jgi:uncharacterized integral membrane protein (TIGR00698 family)
MNFVQKPSPPEQDLARPILPASQSPSPWRNPSAFIPGLALSAAIAAAAMLLRFVPGTAAISSMVVAFILGMVLSGPLGGLAIMSPGTRLAAKTLLRFGVALLGFQLTVYQLADLGVRTLLIVVVVLIATFLFTKWIGRVLGVDRALTELIAAGTSVCGASAIIATNAVTKAPDQDVGYAVACVSLFGTLAMIVYPLLFTAFHFDIRTYGLWAGSSVHEVAQVVAAAFQADPSAGHIAVPVKLARVALLAPLVFTLGSLRFRRDGLAGGAGFPWLQVFPLFMVAFIVLVLLNSAITIPGAWRGWIVQTTTFLLTMSLAAIGLETSVRHLRHMGLRPILLTAVASVFIAAASLLLIEVFA